MLIFKLCQTRLTLLTNTLTSLYCPFSVSVNKYDESCNTLDDPYARICVRYKVKYMNVKVFKG